MYSFEASAALLTHLHYKQCLSVEKIQELLGISFENLMLAFQKTGINVRFEAPKRAYHRKAKTAPVKKSRAAFNSKEWLSDAFKQRGLTCKEAAKEARVSTPTMYSWIKKHKVFKGRKSTKAKIKTLRISKKNSNKLSDRQVTH